MKYILVRIFSRVYIYFESIYLQKLISHMMAAVRCGEDGVNVLQKSESSWHLPNEKIGTSTLINDHPNE